MIDHFTRSRGVGGTDIAAILGLDPRRDAFAVYADKLGLVKRPTPTARMKRGKYFERGVAEWYGDQTLQETQWFDETIRHPDREWQVVTPDAFVIGVRGPGRNSPRGIYVPAAGVRAIGGVDAKSVAWDQSDAWGESGSDDIPPHITAQLQWSCSTTGLPWWDAAAIFGLDEMRVYRVHYSPDLEALMLEAAHDFWTRYVEKRVAPPIGRSGTAKLYLEQKFPHHVSRMRSATAEESELLMKLKAARRASDAWEAEKERLTNEVRLAVGDAEGLLLPNGEKITWRKDADSRGVDWKAVYELLRNSVDWNHVADKNEWAHEELSHKQVAERIVARCEVVTKQGSRKLLCPRAWKTE